MSKASPYLQAEVEHFEDIEHDNDETSALMANVVKQFARIVELSPGCRRRSPRWPTPSRSPGTLADMIASTINSSVEENSRSWRSRMPPSD
jgi:ATP-dependent Lon protease